MIVYHLLCFPCDRIAFFLSLAAQTRFGHLNCSKDTSDTNKDGADDGESEGIMQISGVISYFCSKHDHSNQDTENCQIHQNIVNYF